MAFQLSDKVNIDRVFLIKRRELDVRLDPVFYRPEYRDNEARIKNSGWGYDSVAQIAKRIADGPFGSDLKVEEYQPEGIPLLRVTNLKTGEIDGDLVFISPEKHNQLKRSCVYPNDVVLTKAGSIGFAVVFPESLKEANITSHLVTITCRDDISPHYLSWYFKSKIGLLQIYRWGNKTTRPELNTGEVERILVTTPPAKIQTQIVAKMNVAYAAKKQKEVQAQQLLDLIDTYLLNELGIELPEPPENNLKNRIFITTFKTLESRLDPLFYCQYFKDLEEAIRKSPCNVYTLDEIFEINRGGSPRPINNFITDREDGVNWVKIGDTKTDDKYIYQTSDKIIPEGAKYSRKVEVGDFVLSNSMSFGRPYIMKIEGYIHDGWLLFKPKFEDFNADYFHSILSSNFIYQLFRKSTIGGVVENLNINLVKKVSIPVPPLKKQSEIAAHIQSIRNQAKQLRTEAAAGLEQAKQEVESMILGKEAAL